MYVWGFLRLEHARRQWHTVTAMHVAVYLRVGGAGRAQVASTARGLTKPGGK